MSESTDADVERGGEGPGGPEHHHRMRHQWRDLIEDLIEDGRRRGVFDDLAGSGQPLDLRQNVYEGSSTLANRLLKENDMRPAWLNQRADVLERVEALRADIERTWNRYRHAFAVAPDAGHRTALTIGWDDVCRNWEKEIAKLNKEIESYNLKRPLSRLEILKLRLSDELQRLEAPRYLL